MSVMRNIGWSMALASSAMLLAGCGSYASTGNSSNGGAGLYGKAPQASATPALASIVNISGFAFSAIRVKAGAMVEVKNADAVEHTLTIAAAGVDVQVPAGGSATFVAPSKPGRYALSCDFHHSMHGTITVTA